MADDMLFVDSAFLRNHLPEVEEQEQVPIQSLIKQWVSIDDQLIKLSEQMNELKSQKADLDKTIIQSFEEDKKLGSQIQISDSEVLKFAQGTTTDTLTFVFLQNSLSKIIQNPALVECIVDFVKSSRKTKTTPTQIKRSVVKR
jgi:septal ring factor EnvC (AmiA/AmiB activator)